MDDKKECPNVEEQEKPNSGVFIPDDVRAKMVEYHSVHTTFKTVEARLEELKKDIKEYLDKSETKTYKQFGKFFELQKQDRSKMDEVKTVAILEKLGLTDCIETKKLPITAKIKKAIEKGKLHMEDLADAVTPNIILVLQYKDDEGPKGDI